MSNIKVQFDLSRTVNIYSEYMSDKLLVTFYDYINIY